MPCDAFVLILCIGRFEVEMVLKIVRYLAQQGYGSDKLVVLTPYLGQLRALADALSKDNDPVLNDLDSHDLVRAGLLSSSAAATAKKPLRLATIGKGNLSLDLCARSALIGLGQTTTREKRATLLLHLSHGVTQTTKLVLCVRQSGSMCFCLALAMHLS